MQKHKHESVSQSKILISINFTHDDLPPLGQSAPPIIHVSSMYDVCMMYVRYGMV